MRKTLPRIAVLFSTVALLLPSVSHANAPSLVEPTYELAAKTLSVRIRHWSLVNSLHYIKSVEIQVNGTLLSTNKYDKQPGADYSYTYEVAANPGDVIEVTAKCNLWGSRTVDLTIANPDDALKTEAAAKRDRWAEGPRSVLQEARAGSPQVREGPEAFSGSREAPHGAHPVVVGGMWTGKFCPSRAVSKRWHNWPTRPKSL